jgi:N-acetylneuraminic acid mutarotase
MRKFAITMVILILMFMLSFCNPEKASYTVSKGGETVMEEDSFDFGEVSVGLSSAGMDFVIENTGNIALNVSSVELGGSDPGDFSINPDSVSGELQPEDTLSFSVFFIPTEQQAKSAQITISTDVADMETFSFSLAGTGVEGSTEWIEGNPSTSPSKRITRGIAYIGNQKVILFGGLSSSLDYLGDTWEYDTTTDTWTNMNPSTAPAGRSNFGMAGTDDNRALLFGGFNGSRLDDTWMYEPSSNEWTQMSPGGTLPVGRSGHKMVNGRNGKLYMFGGRLTSGSWCSDLWEYDVAEDTWTMLTPSGTIPFDRSHFGFAYGGDDKLVMFGGFDNNTRYNDTWIYDISDNEWTEQSPTTLPHEREYLSMTYIGNDTVMMFGGYFWDTVNPAIFYNDTWYYSITTNEWTEITVDDPKPSPRWEPSLAWVEGINKLILFGGYYYDDNTGPFGEYYNDTWLYVFE